MSGSQQSRGPFGNNQMLVADPKTRQIKRFLVGPIDCEVTGISWTPDMKTMLSISSTQAIARPYPIDQ